MVEVNDGVRSDLWLAFGQLHHGVLPAAAIVAVGSASQRTTAIPPLFLAAISSASPKAHRLYPAETETKCKEHEVSESAVSVCIPLQLDLLVL
jgi:hypothetical protein